MKLKKGDAFFIYIDGELYDYFINFAPGKWASPTVIAQGYCYSDYVVTNTLEAYRHDTGRDVTIVRNRGEKFKTIYRSYIGPSNS